MLVDYESLIRLSTFTQLMPELSQVLIHEIGTIYDLNKIRPDR
jgi:hypothetical protein